MEETVYTPSEFFDLPDYLQRKILIEELDLESIENLCEAAALSRLEQSSRFFNGICKNPEVWRSKLQYDFPGYFQDSPSRDFNFWINAYKRAVRKAREEKRKYGVSLLLQAIQAINLVKVKQLLFEFGVDPNAQDDYGVRTALMKAVYENNPEIVKMLLSAGADVNLPNKQDRTALMGASGRGYSDIVKILLEQPEIDVNLQDDEGTTALMAASSEGHPSIVRILLERPDTDVNLPAYYGGTALNEASARGHPKVVEELLKRPDIDIDFQETQTGRTALMVASDRGYPKVVEELLKHPNIDVNLESYAGKTALEMAQIGERRVRRGRRRARKRGGHSKIIKLLREAGALE